MAKESVTKTSTEFTASDFSTLNAHADGVIDNEKQLARLKKFRADRVLIKNFAIIALILGVLAILLAIAYNRANAPIIDIVEKPVYIDKPEYIIVKVPDPKHSKVIEKVVVVEKYIKVPIQVGTLTEEFTFFHKEIVNDLKGISSVTRGASYESVESPYPEEQWCYASGNRNTDNIHNRIDLSRKLGTNPPKSLVFTEKEAKEFGSTISALNKAINYCKWHPDRPPIEDSDSTSPIITEPIVVDPKSPPNSVFRGTGFYINNNGYIVTNQHVIDTNDKNNVIDNCSSVWIDDGNSKTSSRVLKQDINLDIAVIKINKKTYNYAKFGEIRTGEDVMALGFPLTDLLGEELKATKGNISALSGLRGDKNYIQYTAPSHRGNSGGPLLNEGGFVVGIVSSGMVGEEFQNLNIAIKGSSAQQFLGKNTIPFEYEEYIEPLKSADIYEQGEKFTVRVLCYQ